MLRRAALPAVRGLGWQDGGPSGGPLSACPAGVLGAWVRGVPLWLPPARGRSLARMPARRATPAAASHPPAVYHVTEQGWKKVRGNSVGELHYEVSHSRFWEGEGECLAVGIAGAASPALPLHASPPVLRVARIAPTLTSTRPPTLLPVLPQPPGALDHVGGPPGHLASFHLSDW